MIKKIDAFIVGSYKAGTTSLKNYLSEHPEIISHPQLELDNFFNDAIDVANNKIKRQFELSDKTKIVLAKNTSFYRNTKALKSIKKHNPDAKIIFIIRNPAQRAYSSWKMEKERAGIKEEFNEIFKAIEEKEPSFLYQSCYLAGLYGHYYDTITKIFKKENIKLIKFETLTSNPSKVCQECFEFLNVDSVFEPNTHIIHNKSSKSKNEHLTKIIKVLSNKNNIFKRAIRKILPYNLFVKIKHSLRKMNQSKTTFTPLNKESKIELLKLYSADIELLENISEIDLQDYKF